MLNQSLKVLIHAYPAILFIDSVWAGVFLLAVTLINVNIGLSGLLAGCVAVAVTRFFQFTFQKSGVHVFNAILVGLSLGAFYQINGYVVSLIILGSVFCVFLTAAMADGFWRMDRLPVLSLPFLITAAITALVAQNYSALLNLAGFPVSLVQLPPLIDNFFVALGSTFFTPHPIAGLVIFICILWYSRYLALLTICGLALGSTVFSLLTTNAHPSLLLWTGFNYALTAIAVGGVYTIPGIASFATAMLAVCICTLFVVSTQGLLFVYGLPVLALPFVLTVLVFLVALRKRTGVAQPWLATEPGLPETNYERARLSKVRYGDLKSVSLLPPFYGPWKIYQGFHGPHTHKAPWQYALDFYITENDASFSNEGEKLQDFHCYGLPVLSPAYGQVIRIYDKFPDNSPDEVDARNN